MSMKQWYCYQAPSLGGLEGTPEDVWGTPQYQLFRHYRANLVVFGLYDLRDYLVLALHRGRKCCLWAGSDIRNLRAGFIFNDGKLRKLSELFKGRFKWFVRRILRNVEHYVENEWEQEELRKEGIEATIVPSFMGDVNAYDVSFEQGNNVYASSGANRQVEYGFQTVEDIAHRLPQITFHLYGAPWRTKHNNVVVHGRVPKEQMNREIKRMQCGLRLNKTDGFSEVTAKSILWGQYPITYLPNLGIPNAQSKRKLVDALRKVPKQAVPNLSVRSYYLSVLNNYPWNTKRHA